jgi:hypothetical protein
VTWIIDTFNNREIAAVLWGVAFAVWVVRKAKIGDPLRSLVKAFLAKKILIPFLFMALYVWGATYLLSLIRVWEPSLLKDTLLWFVGVGLVMFVNLNKAQDDEKFFRNIVLDNLKLVAVLEFVVNFYTFPLWLELILVPIVTMVVVTKAVADTDRQYASVSRLFESITVIYGAAVLAFSIYHAVTDFSGFATAENARSFLLPIALTFLHFPFIYLFALIAKYEMVFVRLHIFNSDEALLRYAKRRILMHFHLNLRSLSRWSRRVGSLKADSKEDVQSLLNS